MGFGHWLAINVTPLLLRLGLAAVFIWAGYGKVAYNDPVSGEDAAILANLGVIKMATALPAPPEPAKPTEAPASAPPATDEPAPAEKPAEPAPEKKPDVQSHAERSGSAGFALVRVRADEPAPPSPATTAPTPAAFTAEDFPTPVMVPRLYQVAVGLHKAAYPTDPAKRLWPTALAEPGTIKMLAWIAALTELCGGALVLFGFMTRSASLGLAVTMIVAMLLTTIGPAVVSGTGFLGFLPPPGMSHAEGSGSAWITLMMQWVLLMAALGLFFAGAGGLSLDRLIFGRGRSKPPAAPKPA